MMKNSTWSENLDALGYDLCYCLKYNPQPFDLSEVEEVVAEYEGENDEDDWRWVIKLTASAGKKHGGRFVFLQGGCDYTGWDCQSWASSVFETTALKAAKHALGDVPITQDNNPTNAGLGHMLNILSGNYGNNFSSVYEDLVKQIRTAKTATWRQQTANEFPDLPKVER